MANNEFIKRKTLLNESQYDYLENLMDIVHGSLVILMFSGAILGVIFAMLKFFFQSEIIQMALMYCICSCIGSMAILALVSVPIKHIDPIFSKIRCRVFGMHSQGGPNFKYLDTEWQRYVHKRLDLGAKFCNRKKQEVPSDVVREKYSNNGYTCMHCKQKIASSINDTPLVEINKENESKAIIHADHIDWNYVIYDPSKVSNEFQERMKGELKKSKTLAKW